MVTTYPEKCFQLFIRVLSSEYARLHYERVKAFKEYIEDVENNLFANKEYSVSLDKGVLEEFIKSVE